MPILNCTGSVTIFERIATGDDAVATIKVVDDAGEVLGATAIEVDGVPTDFSVQIDPALVTGDLFVWAMLRTEVGIWGTLELVNYTEGETIRLVRVED
ncbi:MAG TPA: YbaY family lipoprotein [Aeromicrobium sp.]|nr:YbaY family lipoprotein [Aeromicrobium sp.]